MNRRRQIIIYVIADLLAAMIAWALFYIYRKNVIETAVLGYKVEFVPEEKFYIGIAVLPVCWIIIYALAGTYNDIFRKSRLKEFAQTFYLSAFGVLIIFFSLLLDDLVGSYRHYYHTLKKIKEQADRLSYITCWKQPEGIALI
jgi:hypothetical protein